MFVAFFESLKHVGHLYPIAVLRIYMGYFYIGLGMEHLEGEFLTQPRLAATIMESLPLKDLPLWYVNIMQDLVVPNWQIFAYVLIYVEFLIGISLLLGFLVRPTTLIGAVISLNAVLVSVGPAAVTQQTFLALFIVLFWIGAGRCLGFDYFFYKRMRGLWW